MRIAVSLTVGVLCVCGVAQAGSIPGGPLFGAPTQTIDVIPGPAPNLGVYNNANYNLISLGFVVQIGNVVLLNTPTMPADPSDHANWAAVAVFGRTADHSVLEYFSRIGGSFNPPLSTLNDTRFLTSATDPATYNAYNIKYRLFMPEQIPAPGAAGLLAAAGILAARRRR